MLSAQKRDTWKLIILFFMPAVIIWLTTMIIPFFYGIWISFVKWDGIGNNGISSRNIVKIGTGDTIIPVYYSYDWDDEEDVYYGEEYDVEGKLRVDYSLLLEGEYLYSFCIDDVYGDYYMTDPVAFYVDADGEVMFGY